jgi:hypothetical protein
LACHYGFVVRGLQRLQIETLPDNAAMLRSSVWAMGKFLNEVLLALFVRPAGDGRGEGGRGTQYEARFVPPSPRG